LLSRSGRRPASGLKPANCAGTRPRREVGGGRALCAHSIARPTHGPPAGSSIESAPATIPATIAVICPVGLRRSRYPTGPVRASRRAAGARPRGRRDPRAGGGAAAVLGAVAGGARGLTRRPSLPYTTARVHPERDSRASRARLAEFGLCLLTASRGLCARVSRCECVGVAVWPGQSRARRPGGRPRTGRPRR
jgi:hypothetical protein